MLYLFARVVFAFHILRGDMAMKIIFIIYQAKGMRFGMQMSFVVLILKLKSVSIYQILPFSYNTYSHCHPEIN